MHGQEYSCVISVTSGLLIMCSNLVENVRYATFVAMLKKYHWPQQQYKETLLSPLFQGKHIRHSIKIVLTIFHYLLGGSL